MMSACDYHVIQQEVLPPIEQDVSFSTDIVPIFNAQECTNCHNGTNPSTSLNLLPDAAYNSIISNNYVDTTDAANSVIYYYPLPTGTHFKRYTSQQAQYVFTWIEQGARDN